MRCHDAQWNVLLIDFGGDEVSISKQDVEHVANLARLKLTEEEKERFAEQLGAILAFAGKLNELDTEQVPPTSHAIPLKNVMREDETSPSLPRDVALKNAPVKENGQFKVPAVLED
jgi:aspartyl-tRNA(Asn)/glutamyl-tRNA(Gln) amidotransferase subunit C